MASPTFLRFVVSTAVLCLAVTPARVFPSGDGCSDTGNQTNGSVTADAAPPPPPSPPMGPGGGAGGTIGSLPSAITPSGSGSGGGYLVLTAGQPIVTFTAPYKSNAVAYGWVADGIPVLSGNVNPSSPSVSFYANDLKAAQMNFKSLYFVFVNSAGSPAAFVDVMKLSL